MVNNIYSEGFLLRDNFLNVNFLFHNSLLVNIFVTNVKKMLHT